MIKNTNTSWESIARPNQLAPPGNWNIWMILAGRGFGKTRSAAEAIKKWASSGRFKRIALIANTIQEAKQVMIEGESGLLSIDETNKLEYFPSKRLLKWPNGAIATIYGAENYEQLRGPQFDAAWIDEFAKFYKPKETFDQLSFSLRLGKDPRVILTTTPRPIQFIKDLINREDVVTVRGSSLENTKNLSPNFLKQLEYLKGTKLEAQEIYAEFIENRENTLWSWDDIEKCYKEPPHFLDQVIVAVDPALTSHDHSNETGIIVVGMDAYNKAYVLDDLSVSAAPGTWANIVSEAYKKYNARKVVIESNAGGDLLINLLQTANKDMKIKKVHASTSKSFRAEPIVLLYQKKMVYHAKQFHTLEMQMLTYNSMESHSSSSSPDRLDAMVWGLTELFQISNNKNIAPAAWSI